MTNTATGEAGRATTVFLARHGQTDWNATGRYHGQADVPLNEMGHRQAAGLAVALSGERYDKIYSSALSRARDTAQAVASALGMGFEVDARLAEIDVGEWAGLTEAEVFTLDPIYERDRNHGADHRMSTGETTAECASRVAGAITEIAAANRGGRLLIVGHSYALQAALGALLGWTMAQARRVDGLFNCALTELEFTADDQWRLVAHNIANPELIPAQRSGEIKTV